MEVKLEDLGVRLVLIKPGVNVVDAVEQEIKLDRVESKDKILEKWFKEEHHEKAYIPPAVRHSARCSCAANDSLRKGRRQDCSSRLV